LNQILSHSLMFGDLTRVISWDCPRPAMRQKRDGHIFPLYSTKRILDPESQTKRYWLNIRDSQVCKRETIRWTTNGCWLLELTWDFLLMLAWTTGRERAFVNIVLIQTNISDQYEWSSIVSRGIAFASAIAWTIQERIIKFRF
jgi:hypothetical protein